MLVNGLRIEVVRYTSNAVVIQVVGYDTEYYYESSFTTLKEWIENNIENI